jgi:hypothetical protein
MAKPKKAKVKRGSDAPLFSISGASEALSRSRRTITHALANVRPAKIVSGLKLWHMRDVVAAVNANTQAPILTGNGSSQSGYIAELEADFKAFDVGFAKLEAEPDLARRHALNELLGVGRSIGALERKMREHDTAERDYIGQLLDEKLIGMLMSNFMTLMDIWPSDEEMEQLRAEGRARLAESAEIRPWPAHIQREIDARK